MGCIFTRHGSTSDGSKKEMPHALQYLPTDISTGEAEVVDGLGATLAEKNVFKKSKHSGAAVAPEGGAESSSARPLIQEDVHPKISHNVLKNMQGEQIAAGWPSWLAEVAGEAINGWIPRQRDSFVEGVLIGQGRYSRVQRTRDQQTGRIVVLKKICFDVLKRNYVEFVAREIQVLRRLDHPNVIQLEGLAISKKSANCVYLIFEYMEHDLLGLRAHFGIMFSEAQVKCYLQQLLRGLEHCHGRGVLHRDIKSSNLLLDKSGVLKIADFGLARFYQPGQHMTNKVATLSYRPPELLLGATDYGAAVDLWSTGCILGELLTHDIVFPGQTEVEQLCKIFKLCGSPSEEYLSNSKSQFADIFRFQAQQPFKQCIADTFKTCPESSIPLLETLLAIEPAARGSASEALKSEFFTANPIACDPSSLPHYPPSKEYNVLKEAFEAMWVQRAHSEWTGSAAKKHAASTSEQVINPVPASHANSELPMSVQSSQLSFQATSESKSEQLVPLHEDSTFGFPYSRS